MYIIHNIDVVNKGCVVGLDSKKYKTQPFQVKKNN